MNPTRSLPFLLAAAAAVGAPTAQAQSSVHISGSLDVGVYRDTGGRWNVGTIQRSHLQLDGSEGLGGGLAATFRLRHRFEVDTGSQEIGGAKPFWHGESSVGLKGSLGAVRLGRALDAIQSQDWAFDAWGNYDRIASPAWDLWHWFYSADPVGGGSGRVANAAFYDSPKFANLTLHLSGSPEPYEGAVGKTRAASVVYNDGRWRAMLGAGKNSAGAEEQSLGLRGSWDALTLMGMFNHSESAAGADADSTTLGATYGLGATTLKAGWGQVEVDGATKRRIVSLGVAYRLSKRSSVYADAASKRIDGEGTKHTWGVGLTHGF